MNNEGVNSKLSLSCMRGTKDKAPHHPNSKAENDSSDFDKDAIMLDYLERERDISEGGISGTAKVPVEDEPKKNEESLPEDENASSTDGTNTNEDDKHDGGAAIEEVDYIDTDELYPSPEVVTDPTETLMHSTIKARKDIVLKAEGNASVEDFIEMLGKVISKSERKDIEFLYNDGDRIMKDPAEGVDKTYIRYKIINRKPVKEKKPMVRDDEIREIGVNRHEQRRVRISAQRFCSLVQFDVFATDYKKSTEAMNFLEDTIFSFLHYFKRKGVGEIIFEQQLTDTSLDVYRERSSVKSLQYRIKTEKQYVTFEDIIDDFNFTSN